MVAIFASATALLTPEFVGSFEPEKLAAKFVQVEKETGVKFNKTNSTFNIVGHWDAIQIAHKSLKKLVNTLERAPPPPPDYDQDEPEPEPQATSEKTKKDDEDAGACEKVIPIKGNPKRGRYASMDPAKPSAVPEPVVYFQYQDRSYMSEEVLNLDALLAAFEDNLPDTVKVKKEDLKKILEKNTENMGRPLEKRKAYIQAQAEQKAKDLEDQQQQQLHQDLPQQDQSQLHLGLSQEQSHHQLHQGLPQTDQSHHQLHQGLPQTDQSHHQLHQGLDQGLPQTDQSHHHLHQGLAQQNQPQQHPHQLHQALPQQLHQQPQFQETAHLNGELAGIPDHHIPVMETTREEIEAIDSAQASIEQALRLNEVASMNNNVVSHSSVSLINSAASLSKSAGTILTQPSVGVNSWGENKFSHHPAPVGERDETTEIKDEIPSSDDDFGGDTDDDLSYFDLSQVTANHVTTEPAIQPVPEKPKSPEKPKETAEKPKGKGSKRGRKAKEKKVKLEPEPMEMDTSKEHADDDSDTEDVGKRRSRRKSKPVKYIAADKDDADQGAEQEDVPPPKKKGLRVRKVTNKKESTKTSKKTADATADPPLADDEDGSDSHTKDEMKHQSLKLKIRPPPKEPKQPRKPRKVRVAVKKESNNKLLKLGRPKSNKVYKCTECEYTSHKRTRWTEHMGRVHGLLTEKDLERQKKSQFPCSLCDKSFIFEKDLKRHNKIVHTAVSHYCAICQKSYKSKYVYDKHIATHEEGYVRSMFTCQVCQREFTTKFSLANHIKSAHLGIQKTYLCPTCGKSFNQIRSYRQHANVHAGIKPYVCEICGKGFTYDSSLKDHRYMHDNIRRFACKTCGKAFRQRTSLQIHMKVHKDTKDHICSSCGKGFTQKQSLIRHERIHTGDKPYTCMLCQKTFSDYAVIRRHMMMSHKKDKDEWNKWIISDVKRKSDHYIPGGPGYQSRNRNGNKSYVKAVDANVIMPREDAPPPGTGINITPLPVLQPAPTEVETDISTPHAVTPQPVMQQNDDLYRKEEIPDQTIQVMDGRIQNVYAGSSIYGTATMLPQQQLIMSSATKLVPSTADPNQLTTMSMPINYSIPQNYSANIPSNSPDPLNDDSLNHFLKNESYRHNRPQQQKDMFTPVLAPLSAVAPVSDAQRTQVPFTTVPTTEAILSQAAGLTPWGYAGYPAYFNPANFAQFQGHQN